MLSGCSVILNVIDLRNRKAACKGNDEQTFTFADAYGKIKKHRKRYVSYTKDGEDNRVLKIGRVYRMPRPPQQDSPQVDGLDNFYYESRTPGIGFQFQKGIHNVQSITGPNGESRCPLIIISSTPRKAESEETPWYDRYDSEHGSVKYYGDNKPNKGRPENAPGNKIIHDKVYTTYTVFDAAGNRYVQIDTYGKIDRENPEKISQSIQFDKQTAEFFVDLLKKEFDI